MKIRFIKMSDINLLYVLYKHKTRPFRFNASFKTYLKNTKLTNSIVEQILGQFINDVYLIRTTEKKVQTTRDLKSF